MKYPNWLSKLDIIIDFTIGRKLAGIRASPCGGFLKLQAKIRQAFLSFCMMQGLPYHGISRNCKRLMKVTLADESVREAKRSQHRSRKEIFPEESSNQNR